MYLAATDNAVPTVLFGLLIPLVAAAVALRLSGNFASLVSAIPLPWIVAAQIYCVAGGIFVVLWADGRLPWQFALPAGIGDQLDRLVRGGYVVARPTDPGFVQYRITQRGQDAIVEYDL